MENKNRQGLSQSEAKRKLASIQEITELEPIKNADLIEVAKVKSWKVVVKKGEFEVGDKAVYFEIDSFLPVKPEFEFLGHERTNPITLNTAYEERGYRLSTAKLRGQVSQGLLMNFDNFSDKGVSEVLKTLEVGEDVTELLGVTKFERPEVTTMLGEVVGSFPSHIVSKTDEERIQNEPEAYKALLGNDYYISSKIDGTSTTITITPEDGVNFATRNNTLSKSKNAIAALLHRNGTLEKMEEYSGPEVISIQSEYYGVGVQKNLLGIQGTRLATFNIHVDGVRLGLSEMLDYVDLFDLEIPRIVEFGSDDQELIEEITSKIEKINEKRKKVDPVRSADGPLQIELGEVVKGNFSASIPELIDSVDGTRYTTSNKFQEGVVIRSLHSAPQDEALSFKVINNKFLLKFD